jgi:hypothetical protein
MAPYNSKCPNSGTEELDPARSGFRPHLPSIHEYDAPSPDGERSGKALSLVIRHGIKCSVRFPDLFGLAGVSGYSKRQHEGSPRNQNGKGNLGADKN